MTKFTLPNGKIVNKPFNKIWFVLLSVIILVIFFWRFITLPQTLTINELFKFLKSIFTPQNDATVHHTWNDIFAYMLTLWKPILETLQMSFAGSLIGSLIAVPLALTSARNVIKVKPLQAVSKFIMNIIRSIPTVVIALIAISLVGGGVLSGIIALSIFSFGIMAKMLYEVIETVDMNPMEALESTGANKIQSFRFAIIPQILPTFIGYMIYIFEINIRSSVILGYVGAGGIGNYINDNMIYHYDYIGAIIIAIAILIIVVQLFSSYVRGKLL